VRGLDDGEPGFQPGSLERGVRSELALSLALAITERLCSFEVRSAQVSHAMQGLDGELQAWRERRIGESPCLVLDARYASSDALNPRNQLLRLGSAKILLAAASTENTSASKRFAFAPKVFLKVASCNNVKALLSKP